MKLIFITIILCMLGFGLGAEIDLSISTELGLAISGYNDVRIPNDDDIHSMFSLKDDLSADPVFSSRLQIHYKPHPRHQISLMAAPLTLKPKGSFDRDIIYQNETFAAGAEIDAVYRFDSYRLQYRYFFPKPLGVITAVGASLKLRDAEISLNDGTNKASKTNTGFVPLLSLNAAYPIMEELVAVLEAEGLASPYGRAEDVFVGMDMTISSRTKLRLGYRFLEGGSDNDEVYTFAAVHYALLGFSLDL
ncbi:MAG: hypothetical protein LHW46_02580 [Candidatus Cloacimonetes bacterium]|jgi:hypothetical protein|nr:hypothetical protein [Candidatus Cloacimonadota bacterium]MCB5268862.1 hypothetical protein [Candidatus Cloacimonadota bacterium]MCK9334376.1 hypothetical protein [Candidatus Cloacimonadota bacterium]MDD4667839.1 hypothetical protein [Candidatus Cloacimonadota bacterium]MDY0337851.1 hypothetical protein [Candidatus Cloacimonadaceae bacterium]